MLAVAGGWSKTDLLLATLIDDFRFYMWAKSGGKAKNRPKPIPRPGVVDESRKRMKDALLLPVDEVKRRLALPRRATALD